jgi:hypothetical protein
VFCRTNPEAVEVSASKYTSTNKVAQNTRMTGHQIPAQTLLAGYLHYIWTIRLIEGSGCFISQKATSILGASRDDAT